MDAICRICESSRSDVRVEGEGSWHCVDPALDRVFPYRIAICRDCGHVFGIWDRDRLNQYTDEEYVTCDDDLEQYTAYVEFVLTGLRAMNRKPRILEIGFNRGALLKRFYDIGFECYGIEPGEQNVRSARARMPEAKLYEGLFDADWIDQYAEGFFDVVMMTSVFEHVCEPTDILRAVQPRLRRDGQLFLVVPDLARYTPTFQTNAMHRGVYGCSPLVFFYRNFFLCYGQHINHFSSPSLTRYLAATGFKTTRVADIGNLWVSASPSDHGVESFEFPEIVEYHSALMDYYEELLERTRSRVVDRLADRRVVCYGAGKEFKYFGDVFSRLGVEIMAVGDDACSTDSVNGTECVSPENLRKSNPEICVATSFDYEHEIAEKAKAILPDNVEVVTLTELLSQIDDDMPSFTSLRIDPGMALPAFA